MRSLQLLISALTVSAVAALAAVQAPAQAVILITLDGVRTEEMFGGLDTTILASRIAKGARVEDQAVYKKFWASTPEARREKLMPFFWGTLMREHGSIAGNPALGSRVHVTNAYRISYPGYSEILTGRAHDDTIKSNDPIRNPYRTSLEFLREQLKVPREGVAVFGSWDVFNAIAEHNEGAITVNAGVEPFESPDATVRAMSTLQVETPTPWDFVRYDFYTFRFAMDHLARHKPRAVYLAFDETDDWAHNGRYERVLDALARTDGYLKELWTWLQAQPGYRGRTRLLITTDHGRGHSTKDWTGHGRDVVGASETWMAFVSPQMPERGEWRKHAPLTSAQAAATLIQWMGFDWKLFDESAAPPVR